MSSGEVKAAAVEARGKALSGAELMLAAGQKADELATRLGSVVTSLQELSAKLDGILRELEFDVAQPLVPATEHAKEAYRGLKEAATGTKSEALPGAVTRLGSAAVAAQSAAEAVNGTRNPLRYSIILVGGAISQIKDLPAVLVGNPGDDGTKPYGVASSAAISGQHLLGAAEAIEKWLPAV